MGFTDIDVIYACDKVELDAILEGLNYRAIEERENLSELALNLRYTLNAKKVKVSDLSKKKERNKVRKLFHKDDGTKKAESSMLAKIERLNKHFQDR